MFETSAITISRSALRGNIAFLRSQLGDARLCGVVKGNAYGHGFMPFVPMAMEEGVDYFGVYSADEAWFITQHLESPPDLFIMGNAEGEGVEWSVERGIEFCVHDLDRLNSAMRAAERLAKKALIHIEVETGMHRTGFAMQELETVIERMKANGDRLDFTGLFTHFAGAESQVNDERVREQVAVFERARQRFAAAGLRPRYAHQACSAAVMNIPRTIGAMARVGIMQYGFWSNQETWLRYSAARGINRDPLKRVIGWTSRVMGVSDVETGGHIGYGTSAQALHPMRIAVVPVGYAHGFDRGLSNNGHVLIRGRRAKVTGIVNMNAITVDVTDIADVRKGDEAVLIGQQGDQAITVASFGELSEQLNYELLTRLPHYIPRSVID